VSTARALAQRPDVIYMNSVASVPLLRYVRLPDRPVLLHVHESEVALAPYVITHRKAVTQLPDRYVVVSETLRDTLVERHGIAADRIVVIPAFIRASDLEPFRLANAGEPLPVVPADGRPLVVGGAGSVHWAKGVELWLLVARELLDRLGEGRVRFVWTGIRDDQEGRRFRAMSHLLGLDGTVEFVPETPEPYGHVAGVDIFALTSWEDSWPRVVLEAMYLERPVVCFAGGGGAPAEVGDAGVVVPGFRPVDMAAAIQRLAASPEERLRLGLLAHARVVEHYTSATAIPQLASEIRALAASRTPLPLSAA
jgi:glycosyltransferase involved in cell wall biosynthesis